MNAKELVGVILAAGKGTRMEPFSSRYPKPLMPICNKPVLQYQIEHMRNVGVKEITIVIGHLGYEICSFLGDGSRYGVALRYIEQGEILGIAHALGQIEPYISSPFFLFLGDLFVVLKKDLSSMVDSFFNNKAASVLSVTKESKQENISKSFAVLMNADGTVKRVIEKPRYYVSDIIGSGYLFDLNIFDAIRRTPRTAMRDEYEITDSIQILINDGFTVLTDQNAVWMENITYPYDLLKCNLRELKRQGKKREVGDGATIHPDAKIVNSIIGDNVVIKNPVEIVDSLIFPNMNIDLTGRIDKAILTPDSFIDCRQNL
jgi:NDP-sugar pyrophosphorylase family protein